MHEKVKKHTLATNTSSPGAKEYLHATSNKFQSSVRCEVIATVMHMPALNHVQVPLHLRKQVRATEAHPSQEDRLMHRRDFTKAGDYRKRWRYQGGVRHKLQEVLRTYLKSVADINDEHVRFRLHRDPSVVPENLQSAHFALT